MGTVSARLPDDLEAELAAYLDAENVDRSTAVRQLLTEGLDAWRRERALDALADGNATLSRAAEIADMDIWSFAALAADADVTWVDGEGIASDIEAVDG